VSPALPGAVVRLQKLVGKSWRWVTWKKLDSKSRTVFVIGNFSKKYVARYRVVLPDSPRSVSSTSSVVLVTAPRR